MDPSGILGLFFKQNLLSAVEVYLAESREGLFGDVAVSGFFGSQDMRKTPKHQTFKGLI